MYVSIVLPSFEHAILKHATKVLLFFDMTKKTLFFGE